MGKAKAQREFHSGDIPIDQKGSIDLGLDNSLDHSEIVRAEQMPDMNEAEKLEFMEEAVTIRLERGQGKFANSRFPCHVNGKGAEVLLNDKWVPVGWLPVGIPLVTKRKYVEVIARAKVDLITTKVEDETSERPQNTVDRTTSAVRTFSVLKDTARGQEWLEEIIRRNM